MVISGLQASESSSAALYSKVTMGMVQDPFPSPERSALTSVCATYCKQATTLEHSALLLRQKFSGAFCTWSLASSSAAIKFHSPASREGNAVIGAEGIIDQHNASSSGWDGPLQCKLFLQGTGCAAWPLRACTTVDLQAAFLATQNTRSRYESRKRSEQPHQGASKSKCRSEWGASSGASGVATARVYT